VPSAPFVVPPLLLIAILLVSAVAKLRDPRDTASVFTKMELPPFLTRFKAPEILPYGELAVGALLVVAPGGWYVVSATLTLLLFLAYVVVVARALRFPYAVMCGCFGRLGLGWITRQTLVRNLVLLAIALVTWVDSWRGEGVLERLRDLGDGWWWLAGVALAIVTTTLVVRESRPPWYSRPPESSDEYQAHPVPYAVLDGPEGPGPVWRLTDTAARLLVFYRLADPTAGLLFDRLAAWQERLAPVQVHLVAQAEWPDLAARHPEMGDRLLGDPDGETRLRLGVQVLPGAVLLGADRYLAGGPSGGIDEIEELVAAAAEEIQASLVEPAVDDGQAADQPAQ
jgi:hypothetical protein